MIPKIVGCALTIGLGGDSDAAVGVEVDAPAAGAGLEALRRLFDTVSTLFRFFHGAFRASSHDMVTNGGGEGGEGLWRAVVEGTVGHAVEEVIEGRGTITTGSIDIAYVGVGLR